jgi:hypothetical protein
VLVTIDCLNNNFISFLARAYMSLFDRYDQNEAELFVRDTCFVSTPQRRFEDLFEQIPEHFQYMQMFSNSDESLRNKEATMKNVKSIDNLSIDRLTLQEKNEEIYNEDNRSDKNFKNGKNQLAIDYHSDLFLECISHLLVFNLVNRFDYFLSNFFI